MHTFSLFFFVCLFVCVFVCVLVCVFVSVCVCLCVGLQYSLHSFNCFISCGSKNQSFGPTIPNYFPPFFVLNLYNPKSE